MNIETKYSLGQTLWFMLNNLPVSDEVLSVGVIKTETSQKAEYSFKNYKSNNFCGNGHPVLPENKLFKTKEDLLKSL